MPMLGEILNEFLNRVGRPNDVCQSISVLNVRAKTRSTLMVGSFWSMIGMRTGALFSWSATRNEFVRVKPNILIGDSIDRFVTRASVSSWVLSRTPLRSEKRNPNSPTFGTLNCCCFDMLSDAVQSSQDVTPMVGVEMLKFGKFWVTSSRPGYCLRSPPIENDAGPNCCW